MKKRNLTLAFSSLILGALIGVGIISVKAVIKKELVGMLDDMARRGAGCSFDYDRITIRLSTLKAQAVNPRIVCDGRAMFGFRDLEAKFGLEKLSDNEVMLKNLKLSKGYSIGATPDSPTFKFIDFLVAPLPPEEDYPGRWKLRLYNLELSRGSFRDRIGETEISGRGISLNLSRTPSNDFVLAPKINKLFIQTTNKPSRLISKISSKIDLLDNKFKFNDISLKSALSALSGDLEIGRPPPGEFTGDFDATITPDIVPLPFDGFPKFDAKMQITGQGERVSGKGSIRNSSSELVVAGTDLTFTNLQATIKVAKSSDGFEIIASPQGAGPNTSLDTIEPIKISPRGLAGSLTLTADSISGAGISAYGVESELQLSGELGSPSLKITLHSKLLGTFNTYLSGINGEVVYNRDTFKINLSDAKSDIQLTSNISAPVNGIRTISEGRVYAKGATLDRRNLIGDPIPAPLSLSVDGQLSGPVIFDRIKFEGLADVRVLATDKSLVAIKTKLENGLANLTLTSSRGDISGEISSNLKSNTTNINVKFSDFSPQEFDSKAQCAKISGELKLTTSAGATNGELDINSLILGCEPYTLRLTESKILKISNNSIDLGALGFDGISGSLNLNGFLSLEKGFNISADGQFNLHTFAALIPALDDLKGDINLKLKLLGSYEAPQFSGSASIKNGVVTTEAADLTIDDITGKIFLDGRFISIENLRGNANDGVIDLSGAINLDNQKETVISATFTDIYLKPVESGDAWISGKLSLESDESNTLALGGDILIDRAEVERTITLRSVIRNLLTSSAKPEFPSKPSDVGNLKLNINLAAPQSLFVKANWAELQMGGLVNITGTISNPTINGEIKTLNGWFGINSKRFGITSGKLALRYPLLEPFVDVTAETQLTSQAGDSVLVVLDVKGPISSPKVKFSSDAGLSAPELTKLITKGGLGVSGSIVDVVAGNSEDSSTRNNLLNFLKRLTDIDNLGVEPGYNERTGSVEPMLVAEKQIAPRLKIIGKNSFSTTASQSSLFGALQLSPSFSILTGLENLPLQDTAAYILDFRYSVLKPLPEILTININGNKSFSRNKILDVARLNSSARFAPENLKTLEKSITDFYEQSGYLTSAVTADCIQINQTKSCTTLDIQILEGALFNISGIKEDGDSLATLKNNINYPEVGEDATKDILSALKRDITQVIRKAGYISGTVKTKYESDDKPGQANLIIKTKLGQRSEFVFEGNRKFTATDFLRSINLMNRSQPFGENTALTLLENIERLYRDSGYLYATISYEALPPDELGTRTHKYSITEGPIVKVRRVKVSPETGYSLNKIASFIGKIDAELKHKFKQPRFAIQEEIDYFAELISQKLKEDGYSEPTVMGQILSAEDSQVDIFYEITLNQPTVFEKVILIGLPKELSKSVKIKPPLSITRINKLIETITLTMSEHGYKKASIYSAINDGLEVIVVPGPITKIGEIKVTGCKKVSESLILSNLKLQQGDVWNDSQLDAAKRRILSLGMFLRAELTASDGEINSEHEDLEVSVEERNLRSLDIGAGYNSAFGPHLFSEYIDREIFADGRTLGLRIDTYHEDRDATISRGTISLRYLDPSIFSESVRLTEEARYQKLENGILPYDLDRFSLLSFLDVSLSPLVKGSLGHTLMLEDLTRVNQDAIISDLDNGENILSLISSSITLDKRDSALLPSKGFMLGSDLTITDKIIGSDANYISIGLKGSSHIPLNKDHTLLLSSNLRLGTMFAFGDTEEVPISQRYFVGGHNTIRGFRENSVGPKGADGSPIGGDMLGYTNIELQYNLNEYLQLASFFDAGTTFLESQGLSSSDIRESAGVGTRVLTPLGAISLYAGFPLDEREGESSVRFHFNIGAQF